MMMTHQQDDDDSSTRERVLFTGTQFSILYTSMYSPAEAATHDEDDSSRGTR
jgi:hypothetical protein